MQQIWQGQGQSLVAHYSQQNNTQSLVHCRWMTALLSFRYDLNQSRAVPSTQNRVEKTDRRILWSTVSKAAPAILVAIHKRHKRRPWCSQLWRSMPLPTTSLSAMEFVSSHPGVYHIGVLGRLVSLLQARSPTPGLESPCRCFYHLRQLQSVRRSLTTDSAKTLRLVHALIASRLDYCNSVLYQINTTVTRTLQSVLHSAVRLIMRKRKFDRITPTLRDDFHWLPVPERIVLSYAWSSSSVAIKPHQSRPTSRSCVFLSHLARVVATYALPLMATFKC